MNTHFTLLPSGLLPPKIRAKQAESRSQFVTAAKSGDTFAKIRFGQSGPPAPKKDLKARLAEIRDPHVAETIREVRAAVASAPPSDIKAQVTAILESAEARLTQSKARLLADQLADYLESQRITRYMEHSGGGRQEKIIASQFIPTAMAILAELRDGFTDENFTEQMNLFWRRLHSEMPADDEKLPFEDIKLHHLHDYLSRMLGQHRQPQTGLIAEESLWNPLVALWRAAEKQPGADVTALVRAVDLITDQRESKLSQRLIAFHEDMLAEMEESEVWQRYQAQMDQKKQEPESWHGVAAGMTQWQSRSWPYLMQTLRDEILPRGASLGLARQVIRVLTETPNKAIQGWCIRALQAMHDRNVPGIRNALIPHRDYLLKLMETTETGQRFKDRPMAWELLKDAPENLLPLLSYGHEYLRADDECAKLTRQFIQPDKPEQTLKAAAAMAVELPHVGWKKYIEPQDWPVIHHALEGLWDRYLLGERRLPEALTGKDIYALSNHLHEGSEVLARILLQVATHPAEPPEERLRAFDSLSKIVKHRRPEDRDAGAPFNADALRYFKQAQDELLASSDDAFFLKAMAIAAQLPHELAFRDHLNTISFDQETRPEEFFLPRYVQAYLPYQERLNRLLSDQTPVSPEEDDDRNWHLQNLKKLAQAMREVSGGAPSSGSLPSPDS